MHCLHILSTDELSLKPPSEQLAGLSAETVDSVPKRVTLFLHYGFKSHNWHEYFTMNLLILRHHL